jgi:excisionase family DNA binding protein
MIEPALLSADNAAAWLGVSRSSVFRLVREGRLIAVRPFRELRFRQADLEAFVAGLEPANPRAGSVPANAGASDRGPSRAAIGKRSTICDGS